MPSVPASRIRDVNARPIRGDGRFVLYWMVAHRRLTSNFALQHAVALSCELARPLVIFEPLRVDYAWANDRLHRFAIDGMSDHAAVLAGRPVTYLPHVERMPREGRALFDALCQSASVVVTDDYPAFFLPRMIARAGARLEVALVAVDSNGLLPMRAAEKPFTTAFAFRGHMQRHLRSQLEEWPAEIRWNTLPPCLPLNLPHGTPAPTSRQDLDRPGELLRALPIDHAVRPSSLRGGPRAGHAALQRFLTDRLAGYVGDHNHPDVHGTSGLSPYLRFGHLSSHEVFSSVMTAEKWTSRKLGRSGGGKREGWWGTSAAAQAFLDQLITWRELGFSTCATQPDGYDTLDALPPWARRTLDAHASDPRAYLYTLEALERAETHDEVWNAAERQLTQTGWMHNYLRMLWGKKILEWSVSPQAALEAMIHLMNKYALDGRDPNSYTGYTWVLGRYDRPWGPERPIFGTVRYMSSDNTVKKLRIKNFLKTYGAERVGLLTSAFDE